MYENYYNFDMLKIKRVISTQIKDFDFNNKNNPEAIKSLKKNSIDNQ